MMPSGCRAEALRLFHAFAELQRLSARLEECRRAVARCARYSLDERANPTLAAAALRHACGRRQAILGDLRLLRNEVAKLLTSDFLDDARAAIRPRSA
jgi:gamma-glutamyltranspeptidase